MMALTATATPRVQADIVAQLRLRNPLVAKTTFNRPNLSYSAYSVPRLGRVALRNIHMCGWMHLAAVSPKKFMKKDLSAALAGLKPHDSVVVYCVTRKETEEVSACLNRLGFKAAFYHAQLPHQQRSRVHEQVRRVSDGANGTSACVCEVPEAPLYVTMCVCVYVCGCRHVQFLKDELQVVAATVAFGMGIDKPDIRLVIHYGVTKTVEDYYQHTGRAGRDGAPSRCVMYYSGKDFATQQYLVQVSEHTCVDIVHLGPSRGVDCFAMCGVGHRM